MGGDRLTVAWVGDEKAGKSSLLGRLQRELGCVTAAEVESAAAAAAAAGRPDLRHAFLLDRVQDERAQMATLDAHVARVDTPGKLRRISAMDLPGRPSLVRNAATGMTQADAAVLVVSAVPGALERALRPGAHGRLLALM